MAIEKVTLVGANGNLGAKILDALVGAKTFQVTVLVRKSSSSRPPRDTVRLVQVGDDFPFDQLKTALQGQDAVVACFSLKDPEQHIRLLEASVAAGVRRFLPADWGSCDSASPRTQELVKLYSDKARVQRRAEELAREHVGFTWTSIVCGHFFDWGLHDGFMHVDIPRRRAEYLDQGTYRASASTLHRVAEAAVRVLERDEVTGNRVIYVQSFCVTQAEVVAALERVTGKSWSVSHLDSAAFLEEQKEALASGSKMAVEELVFYLGTVDANWEERDGFGMKLLGLDDEDLDVVIARVVSEEER
jgi:putative NADH-flavin reductase